MASVNRRHGFYVLIMILGTLLPPIAVLVRFGFGTDFFINCLLTICGYIPGYLQNIRNNQNRKRTPAWATKAGLIKDPAIKRRKKAQWANRYDERTPTRADGYQDEEAVRAESISSSSTNTAPIEAQDLDRSPRQQHRRQQSRESFFSASHGSAMSLRPEEEHGLRRSLSSRFLGGFGKKSNKKDRFRRSKEARDEWNNTLASSLHDHNHPIRRTHTVAGDGLDHAF